MRPGNNAVTKPAPPERLVANGRRALTALSALMLATVLGSLVAYYFIKWSGFFPTLSESALTKVSGPIYSFGITVSATFLGIVHFSLIGFLCECAAPATRVALRAELCGTVTALCFQANVPFSKSRSLDAHVVAAGLFFLLATAYTAHLSVVAWRHFRGGARARRRMLALRCALAAAVAVLLAQIVPYLYAQIFTRNIFKHRKILSGGKELLSHMGRLQFALVVVLLAHLASFTYEARALSFVARWDPLQK
eukprot:gnl/Chilomastix_cuspidata/2948.p2 GENE.gnl/Chilomastix_cuspidata/2948~~gnl/Chilomastix_cuspidata/2948.p2  ORF type:complete len:251 (-),score=65.08 gnl/Chilomastix_cuspidata/2948:1475-2227(-)